MLSSNNDANTTGPKIKHLLTQCFDIANKTNAKCPNPHPEIDDYLNCEVPDDYSICHSGDGDIDILAHWKENQSQYPGLSLLAKQVYAIPASNTVVERLFSMSKNTINEKRTNLVSEKINQLLFLKKNFC